MAAHPKNERGKCSSGVLRDRWGVEGPRLGRVVRVRAVPLERAEEVLEAASPRVRGKVRRNSEERVQARIAPAEELLALDLA